MTYFGLQMGVWTIFLGLSFNVFICIKAIYEGYMQWKSDWGDDAHKRAHIAGLGVIAAYSIYDLFSFAWFMDIYYDNVDYTVSFFNLLFVNIIWLFIIHHFKQERTDDYSRVTWWKLINF